MKKPLVIKIIGLAVLYCAVFCILAIMQFSNRGNFSLPVGGMTVRGHYLQGAQETRQTEDGEDEAVGITGGITIFFGGLEFNLRETRGRGLMLTNAGGGAAVNPESMFLYDNLIRFFLPGGTVITFVSIESPGGQELQISADLAADINEVTIPIIPRRSSLIQDSGQLGIMFSGSRYVFSSLGQELEKGGLVFSKDNSFISYRTRGRQRAFDPADYVVAQVQNYANILRNWQDSNFIQWNQNAAALQTEDEIIAYMSQSVQRGNFTAAVRTIPQGFVNSQRHSYRSSVFVGGMENAYTTFTSAENEKLSRITRLARSGSLDVLKHEHVLDYLFTRSSLTLANDVIDIVSNANPSMLISEHCPGLLEVFFDLRRWRPEAANPIEHLQEQMLVLISEVLNKDTENDAVYASSMESNNSEFSLRLGKGLVFWADAAQNAQWSAIGRSLIISAVYTGNSARLYNILNPGDYNPRAAWLTNAGHWAWTASPSVRASEIGGNLNLAVTFPPNMTHHLIIRGVRPFLNITIHGLVWRSDPQFEIYDSSGWVYYPEDQILVVRLRHRSSIENIRLIYRYEQPAPAPPTEDSAEAAGE